MEWLHSDLTSARADMEKNPSPENTRTHNQLKEQLNTLKNQEIQNSWHEKTRALNLERDTTKLWKLTRALDEDCSQTHARTVIEDASALHTGKMAANILADAFQEVSKLEMPKESIKVVDATKKENLSHPPQA